MQSVSSKTWTRVAASIFYNDNHYTTGTSITPQAPQQQRYLPIYYITNILLLKEPYFL